MVFKHILIRHSLSAQKGNGEWWVSNQWLSGFAYRTTIGIGVFLLAGANYPADHDRYDQFPGLPDGDSESGKEPEE